MLVKVDNNKFYEFLIEQILIIEDHKKGLEDRHSTALKEFQEGMESSVWFRFKHRFYQQMDMDAMYLWAAIQQDIRKLYDLINIERIISYNIRNDFTDQFTVVDTNEHPIYLEYIKHSQT